MLDAGLPKTGVVRSAATAIVYATHEMGGLGFKDVHVTQLIEHVKILLDHDSDSGRKTTTKCRRGNQDAEVTYSRQMLKSFHGLNTTGYGQQFRIFISTIFIYKITTSKN